MAHEIEKMMYVGRTPWHGLGTSLDSPPTMHEAIELAGLDWAVETRPLHYRTGAGSAASSSHVAVVRVTDDRELGVVGPNWTPLQNRDAFTFFQPFLDAGEVTLETAGSLRGGSRVWVLARIQRDPIEVVKGDAVLSYLLLANGHDGSLAVSVGFTPIRVVCANTLAVSLAHRGARLLRAYHNKNVKEAVDAIEETVDVLHQTFVATAEQYRELARHQISEAELKTYVQRVFVPRKKQQELNDELANLGLRTYDKIVPLFEKGHGNDLPGVKGTWWGAYNAVTEYLNHERGRSQDGRVDSLWFGPNAADNHLALRTALEMAPA